MIISVIGDSQAPPDISELAEQVGQELGKRGIVLVCGGLTGVMESACRGAKATGGTTIGILPGLDPAEANPWVDFPICTGLGHARNIIVVRSSVSVIAISGAYGTLSEIAYAKMDGIPIVGLHTWNEQQLSREWGEPRQYPQLWSVRNPVEAVEKAITEASQRSLL